MEKKWKKCKGCKHKILWKGNAINGWLLHLSKSTKQTNKQTDKQKHKQTNISMSLW